MISRIRWLPLLALLAACDGDRVSAVEHDPIRGGRSDIRVTVPAEAMGRPAVAATGALGEEPGTEIDPEGDGAKPFIVSMRTDVYLHDAVARARGFMEYYAQGATQTVTLQLFEGGGRVGESSPATSTNDGLWDHELKSLTTYTNPIPVARPCGHQGSGHTQHAAYSIVPNTSLSTSQVDRIAASSSAIASQPACTEPPPPPPSGDDGGSGPSGGWEICYWWAEYDSSGNELRRTLLYCESL